MLSAPGPEWSTPVTAERRFEVGPGELTIMKTTKDKAGSTLFWTSKVKLVAKDA